jgi:hypothetical protein
MRPWRLLAAVLIASSCSVKEDRGFCPAWCVVYSDGYVAEGCRGELTCNLASSGQGNFEYGRKDFSSFKRRGDLVLEVPRYEQVFVDVFCGVDEMELNGSVLAIPLGFCCDSIYSGHGSVFIAGEEGETGLPLNKDFASLVLRVEGEDEEESPFTFRILGNVDGYELPGGAPHRGEFDFCPSEEAVRVFRARVPRQNDGSLMLEIYDKTDASLVTRQKLGEIIMKKGYDWAVPDLPDIDLYVNLSESSFIVEIGEWEISETVNVIL